MLDREKDAVEVDRVLLAPVAERHVDDRGDGDADAGIGDENIEPAKALRDLGCDLDPALFAGDILLQENRLAAGLGDAIGELGAAQLVDVGGDDGGALARKQLNNCLANSGCAAGHQRDLALNLPCHVHSLFCYSFFVVCRTYLIMDGPWSGSATSMTRNCTRSAPW